MTRRKKVRCLLLSVSALLLVGGLCAALWFQIFPQRTYTAEDFHIMTYHSSTDYNNNGIDDATDFLLGARKDAENHPRYDGSYRADGFPPDDVGVCTDVVWRAFRQAGYNLREMVDHDIAARPSDYPAVTRRDKNIDFRRVRNLRVFFDAYAVSLSTDPDEIAEWQPGDIVIFGDNQHIGVVSDKRNASGHAFILHNAGQPKREEDYLGRGSITKHYRFDASLVDPSVLVRWNDTSALEN